MLALVLGVTTAVELALPSPPQAELGKRALSLLSRSLTHEDPEVRAAAAAAWGAIGNPAAARVLKRALNDKNVYVRIEAATSLHSLGAEEGIAALERIVRHSTAALTGLSPAEEMRWLARNKSRILAIDRLSEIGGERAVELFERTLRDPSGAVRDATSVALARMGFSEFGEPFAAALRDRDEAVRATAARALGEIGRPEWLSFLRDATADPSVAVRAEAMRALARFSDPGSLKLLAQGTKDEDARVRAKALAALAQGRDLESSSLLRGILGEATAPEIKLKAMAGLARRGEKADLSWAVSALRQKDSDLKLLAIDVLRAVEEPASDEILAKFLEEEPDPRLKVGAAAILVKRLRKAGQP